MLPVRFIVLSSARSGSTLLVALLRSHPQICCEGEIFHEQHPDKIFWSEMSSSRTTPEVLALRDSSPSSFLERHVFVPHDPQIAAIGFKIFYYHCARGDWQPVWSCLRDDEDLRVIHLTRRNQLARVLSDKIANTTDRWSTLEGSSENLDLTVTLDAEHCRGNFEWAERQHRRFAQHFAGHPVLELCYEELASNIASESERIADFLGIERRLLSTNLKKQNRRTPKEVIENYDQLERIFAGTPWDKYFVDR